MNQKLAFIQERTWSPKTLDEVLDISRNHLEYETHSSEFANFSMTKAGLFQGDGLEFRFTETGFLQLCKMLKIPNPFANFITWDLLRDNINRIARDIIDKNVIFYFYEDHTGQIVCVNVSNDRRLAVSNVPFMELLGGFDLNVERILLNDNLMDVYLVNPDNSHVKPLEVQKGDIIKSGLRLRNSPTAYSITEARPMFWRLVCTNGMVMPTSEGQLKCRLKPTNDYMPKVKAFMTKLELMASDQTEFPDFNSLTDKLLETPQFARYWKQIKRAVGDSQYVDDFIFELDEDRRKEHIAQAKLVSKEEAEPEITTVNAYNLLNNLTHKAKDYPLEVQAKMEEIGGKMIKELA